MADFSSPTAQSENARGLELARAKQFDAAIACFQKALELQPDYLLALNNLGAALIDTQRFDQAIPVLRRAIQINPARAADTSYNLAKALSATGQLDQAIDAYVQAIALNPSLFPAYMMLGIALHARGRREESRAAFQGALRLKPDHSDALSNLGAVLSECGEFDQAIAAGQRAVQLNPNSAPAFNNLCNTLSQVGRLEEAIECGQRAIALRPNYLEAYANLAVALERSGQTDRAVDLYNQAIARAENPTAFLHVNLAGTLSSQGRLDEALSASQLALKLRPMNSVAWSNRLLMMHFQCNVSPEEIFQEHRKWERSCAMPLYPDRAPQPRDPNPRRRLRIGYLSPDFRRHSVNYFLDPIFANHNHEQFEIISYADQFQGADFATDRLRSFSDQWRDVTGHTDDAIADQIRADEIDTLIDLAGHTGHNHLLVFARKPAPIQITYLGYPDTTGLSVMDYRLTDALADPPGLTEHLHTEKLLRLPRTAWCYQPPDASPDVEPTPALVNRYVTFGSFNVLSKINADVISLWSKILLAIPKSRLLMKNKSLNDSATLRRIQNEFARHGVTPDQLDFRSHIHSFEEHLQTYRHVDIMLDPFPYAGTTSTCEALWMGVPVITLAGQIHASRVGVSLLTNVALPHLIAGSPDAYIQIARNLACDPKRLNSMRMDLRQGFLASPLFDAVSFTRELERIYRAVWRDKLAAR